MNQFVPIADIVNTVVEVVVIPTSFNHGPAQTYPKSPGAPSTHKQPQWEWEPFPKPLTQESSSMSEMLITSSPEVKKILDDYDFFFESGMSMSVTLDFALGDSIKYNDLTVVITKIARPNPNNPAQIIPAEDTTLFINHIISVQHRQREVVEFTPEEKQAWAKTWEDLISHPTVQ